MALAISNQLEPQSSSMTLRTTYLLDRQSAGVTPLLHTPQLRGRPSVSDIKTGNHEEELNGLMRTLVLGSRNGSPRRGRKCVTVLACACHVASSLERTSSTPSTPADVDTKRTMILGCRNGTPGRRGCSSSQIGRTEGGNIRRLSRKAASEKERRASRGIPHHRLSSTPFPAPEHDHNDDASTQELSACHERQSEDQFTRLHTPLTTTTPRSSSALSITLPSRTVSENLMARQTMRRRALFLRASSLEKEADLRKQWSTDDCTSPLSGFNSTPSSASSAPSSNDVWKRILEVTEDVKTSGKAFSVGKSHLRLSQRLSSGVRISCLDEISKAYYED